MAKEVPLDNYRLEIGFLTLPPKISNILRNESSFGMEQEVWHPSLDWFVA